MYHTMYTEVSAAHDTPISITAYETSTDVATLKQQPDIIAKRIEQEIQSARAFAERKYNDNSANNIIDIDFNFLVVVC